MVYEKIKAKEYYVKDLLSNKFLFEIPDYQRAYSWTKENLSSLMYDINGSINNGKESGKEVEDYEPYFIGSIVLCSKEYKDDGWGLYDVIDGQQRLTSIIMLIATIRDLTENEEYKKILSSLIYQKPNPLMGIKESIRVKVRGRELDFFKKYILTDGGTIKLIEEKPEELSEAMQNMCGAVEVYRNEFINDDGEINASKLEDFIMYLLQKVVLVVITTDSFASAFRLFNVINARGLPLTNADLLKSENLRVINEEIRDKYTELWENNESELGKDKLEDIIGIIRIMKQKRKAQTTIFEEFNKNIFEQEDDYRGCKFIEHLNSVKELYNKYIVDANINLENKSDEIYYKNLVSLMRDFIPFEDWIAAVIRCAEKYNDDAKVLAFVKKLEKRIVIDWVNGNSFSDRLSRVYSIIKEIDNSDTIEKLLRSQVFVGDLERTSVYFENSLNDIEFYSKGRMAIPKYILMRMDMELREGVEVNYSNKIMLEHVLPRNAKDVYWTDNFNAEEKRNWANRLGNLVIIDGAKNTRANNKPFPVKVDQYLSKKGTFEITQEVCSEKNWDMKTLEKRQNNLIKRAMRIWTK